MVSITEHNTYKVPKVKRKKPHKNTEKKLKYNGDPNKHAWFHAQTFYKTLWLNPHKVGDPTDHHEI